MNVKVEMNTELGSDVRVTNTELGNEGRGMNTVLAVMAGL